MSDRRGRTWLSGAVVAFTLLGTVAGATGRPRIVNGLVTHDFPTTGALLYGGGLPIDGDNAVIACSGTLIGCHTFLTAAHCVASDLVPSHYDVYLQNAGIVAASGIVVHPAFDPSLSGHDVAIVTLATDVTGIAPTPIDATHDLSALGVGLAGLIVGFGETSITGQDFAIKRYGAVQTANCVTSVTGGEGNDKLVCWDFAIPVGPPGQDSDTCHGDSGGPLFMDFGAGLEVVGVTSTGSSPFCRPLDHSRDASVFYNASWLLAQLATDSTTTCGSIDPVGAPSVGVMANDGTLSPSHPSDAFTIEVGGNASSLRVALNGQYNAIFNPDLYLKQGPAAGPASFDCKADGLSGFGSCDILFPNPGTWSILVTAAAGAGQYQLTTTVFGGSPPSSTSSTSTTSTTVSTTTSSSSTTSTTRPPCAPVTGAALTLTRIGPPPGDDGLAFKGGFTVTLPVGPLLDPVANGIGIRIADGPAVVVDVQVPSGAFDPATGVGWKVQVKKGGTQWTFVGPKTGAAGGVTKVALVDRSAKTPGLVSFAITGKAGSYAAGPAVVGDVVLPASGACFEATFPATPPQRPGCMLVGTTLKCR